MSAKVRFPTRTPPDENLDDRANNALMPVANPRSGPLRRLKQPAVLEDRVPIRHPGDVIRDRTRATGGTVRGLRLHGLRAVFRWHQVHVLEKGLEQLPQHDRALDVMRSTL